MSEISSIVVKSYHQSPHPQNPEWVRTVEGEECIVDKRGIPRFYIDGSPVPPNSAHQCIAKSRRSGYRCIRFAVTNAGYKVCQKHGAGSPMQGRPGGRAPSVGSSRWNERLPSSLRERFEASVTDPDLLAVDQEIRVLDVRIGQLLERLPEADKSAVYVEHLREGMMLLKEAHRTKDPEQLVAAVTLLDASYDPVVAERANWAELTTLMQQRARLVKREEDRRKAIKNYIKAEEAWALIQSVVHIINDEIEDKEVKNRINLRMQMAFKAARK